MEGVRGLGLFSVAMTVMVLISITASQVDGNNRAVDSVLKSAMSGSPSCRLMVIYSTDMTSVLPGVLQDLSQSSAIQGFKVMSTDVYLKLVKSDDTYHDIPRQQAPKFCLNFLVMDSILSRTEEVMTWVMREQLFEYAKTVVTMGNDDINPRRPMRSHTSAKFIHIYRNATMTKYEKLSEKDTSTITDGLVACLRLTRSTDRCLEPSVLRDCFWKVKIPYRNVPFFSPSSQVGYGIGLFTSLMEKYNIRLRCTGWGVPQDTC